MTRWKHRSGHLGNWRVRGIAAALALIVLGLALPAPSSDAARGTKTWASANVDFELKGYWTSATADSLRAYGTRTMCGETTRTGTRGS